MFFRRTWQKLWPLARRAIDPSYRNLVPARHMAFGIPSGSTNKTYLVLCGGGLTAAVVYAYKTVSGDSERYDERLSNIKTKAAPAVEATAAPAESGAVEEDAPVAMVIADVVAEPVEETRAAEPSSEPAVEAEPSSEPAVEAEPSSEEAAAPLAEGAPAAVVADAAGTVAEPEVKGEDAAPVAVEAVAVEEVEAPASGSAGTAAAVEEEPSPLPEVETAPAGPDAEASPRLAA